MKPSLAFALLSTFLLVALSSCEEHSTAHDDEHKVPGTFILQLISDSDTVRAVWSDPDGPGGNPPQVTPLSVQAGNYRCSLAIIATDGDTLTDVIRQQGTEHQIFYTLSQQLAQSLTISVTDRDTRGMPLGLETSWTVAQLQAPINGTVRIQLYHYDANTKDGQNPSPETDADISFSVELRP